MTKKTTAPVPATTDLDVYELLSWPSGYASIELKMALYPWQAKVMDTVAAEGSRVSLRTCNESGKTQIVISALVLWHMETFPESLTVTTSGSYRQIVDQLYPALKAYTAKKQGWRILRDTGVYEPTGSRLVSFSTDDAGRAEGYHEPPRANVLLDPGNNMFAAYGVPDETWSKLCVNDTSLLMIMDEAKSIDIGIFNAWERCRPTRFIVASSPGAPIGPFYDAFHSQKQRYRRFHVSWEQCPHLFERKSKRREILEQVESYGDHHPLVQSMVFGNFAVIGERLVYDLVAVDKAMSGLIPQFGRGAFRAALDLSGGGDETCLYVANGNEARLAASWHEQDTDKLTDYLVTQFFKMRLRPEWIWADNGGLGSPIIDRLSARGWPINRIDFSGTPNNPKYYRNIRAEMHMELAKRIKNEEVRLPRDETLKEQLGWHQYKIKDDGKMLLDPKDKMPHSPDRADTVAMLFYGMPGADTYEERKQQRVMAESKTMLVSDSSLTEKNAEDSGEGWLWNW